jgi:hypothetical protein
MVMFLGGLDLVLTMYRALDIFLSLVMHAFHLSAMACFILFIEKTILMAGISGVHTIRTTGQLIPFIIGIVSLTVTARELFMLWLRKVSVRVPSLPIDRTNTNRSGKTYPDWERYHFAVNVGIIEGVTVQLVKRGGQAVKQEGAGNAAS